VNNDWRAVSLPPASSEISARIIKYRTKEVKYHSQGFSGKAAEKWEKCNHKYGAARVSLRWGYFSVEWGEPQQPLREKKARYFAALFNYATLPISLGSLRKGEKAKISKIRFVSSRDGAL